MYERSGNRHHPNAFENNIFMAIIVTVKEFEDVRIG
jgi:hypothetical protein